MSNRPSRFNVSCIDVGRHAACERSGSTKVKPRHQIVTTHQYGNRRQLRLKPVGTSLHFSQH